MSGPVVSGGRLQGLGGIRSAPSQASDAGGGRRLGGGGASSTEMDRAATDWDRREHSSAAGDGAFNPQTEPSPAPSSWRGQVIPPGAVIAFAAPDDPPGDGIPGLRWTAYLARERGDPGETIPRRAGSPSTPSATSREIHHPRAELVLRLPDGWLYRVKTPESCRPPLAASPSWSSSPSSAAGWRPGSRPPGDGVLYRATLYVWAARSSSTSS